MRPKEFPDCNNYSNISMGFEDFRDEYGIPTVYQFLNMEGFSSRIYSLL
jgi:hypothetical protein